MILVPLKNLIIELSTFGLKLLISCKFAICFFALLAFSQFFTFWLPRYDFLLIAMLLVQAIFIHFKIETFQELKVITCFHIIGLIFELFKTHPSIGSWSYPEPSFFRIGTVPLYSGFMYASVASFVIQSWRVLNIELKDYPSPFVTLPLAILIYAHFFIKYIGIDLRGVLLIAVFVIYLKTKVFFTTTKRRHIPLSIGFLLVGFCLWIAENISTFLRAWQYPHQAAQWSLVGNTKIGAWFLLYVVSFILVTNLILFQEQKQQDHF